MFKKDGVTYASKAEWQLDNQISNAVAKKPKPKRKHKRNYHRKYKRIEVWHMKEHTIDIPLNARCILRLTKSTPFHTNNGKPNQYDWKHSRIQIVLDDKPIEANVHGKPIERGDQIPVKFEINGQEFTKVLLNVKGSVFTVAESKEAKQIMRQIVQRHM